MRSSGAPSRPAVSHRLALALVVGAALVAPVAASPVDIVAVVRDGTEPLSQSKLLGSSGQVYVPTAKQTWRRAAFGGVAADLTDAVASGATIFAFANRSPIYRYHDDVWHARLLPNRGRTTLAAGPTFGLAVGRHVYTLKRGVWRRLASGRFKTVAALWMGTDKDVAAADSKGKLWRYNGKRWTSLALRLPKGEQVRGVSRVGASFYVHTGAGRLLRVVGTKITALPTPKDLPGLMIEAVTIAGGTLIAIGRAASRAAVLQVNAATLVVAGDMPAKERVRMLHADSAGDLLISTHGGGLWVRNGGTWVQGTLLHTPPAQTVAPGPGSRPAKLR